MKIRRVEKVVYYKVTHNKDHTSIRIFVSDIVDICKDIEILNPSIKDERLSILVVQEIKKAYPSLTEEEAISIVDMYYADLNRSKIE